MMCLLLALALVPPMSLSSAAIAPSPADTAEIRQTSSTNILASAVQGLSDLPQNILNTITGQRPVRQVGEECQYTTDCLAGTPNSVCFNGTCLCNLRYRFDSLTKDCVPVETCETCEDRCESGTDVYCNSTCISNFKRYTVGSSPVMLHSPEWPGNYPPNTDVYYCLKAPVARKVHVQFKWLDLETHCGFNCDYMRIYNGCRASDKNIIAFYTGDNVRSSECVQSTCNEMLIHFHTDGVDEGVRGDQRSGFMGHYREVPFETDACKV